MKPTKFILCVYLLVFYKIGCAQQPKLIIPTGNTGQIDNLEFSQYGKYLISTFGSDEIILWNLSTKQVVNQYKLPGRITSAKFSYGGSLIAAGSTDGSLAIWKYSGKDSTRQFRKNSVINQLAFTPDSKYIISCNTDTTIQIFDLLQNKVSFILKTGDPLDNITVSHNGGYAAFGDRQGKVYLFNIITHQKEFFNKVCDGPIHQLRFDSKDSLLAAVDGNGMAYIVNLQPFKILYSIKAFTKQAFSISFFKNYLIATGRDNSKNVKFFRLADGEEENLLSSYHENTNAPNFIYGIYNHALSDDGTLAIPNSDGTITCWNLNTKREDFTLRGSSSPIYDIDTDHSGLLYFAADNKVGIYDLKGSYGKGVLLSSKNPVYQVNLGSTKVAALSADTIIYIINSENNASNSYRVNQEAFAAPVRLINNNELIYRISPNGLAVKNLLNGKSKLLKIKDCYNYKLSKTGNRIIAYSNKNEIQVWDRIKWKIIKKIPATNLKTFDINDSGDQITGAYTSGNHLSIRVSSLNDNRLLSEISVPDSINIDRVYLCNNGEMLVSISRTAGKFNESEDYSIRVWDLKNEKYAGKLTGHTALISDIALFNNNTLISAGNDGTIRLWSLINNKEIASIIPFRDGEWVVINQHGIFDASPMAMQRLHFIFNNEEINLNQLKENFYEPKLLQKILGYTDEPYAIHLTKQKYSLYPEIRLVPPDFNDGILTASFKDQGGGIGKISVLINGKEAIEDARHIHGYDSTNNTLEYPVTNHPYLKSGSLNKLSVIVYNDKGYKISNEKSIYLLPNDKGGSGSSPDFYGIIIGISDYKGNDIDLTFAAKDAEDFASAIQLGASKYLGPDHVFIHRLTTLEKDSTRWPSKHNIENTFSEIAAKAKPSDILLVYISGHGMDNADDNEFYFLTADAGSRTIEDPKTRPMVSISSSNLVKLVKQVPSLKELMIIDACHSGNILSGLDNTTELNSGNIRALERVKDRTGMYILASSEGQDVSYESNLFDQGLLTYSLLFGLKGAGLREGDMADVVGLLQFVNGNVPVLASDIGKSQLPVIKIPDGISSFNIGKLTTVEKDKIDIKSPKPMVARSNFQNEATYDDNLKIGQLVDSQLKDYRDLMNNKFMFLDENFYNNALQVYGRYKLEKNILSVHYKVFKNNNILKEESLSSDNAEDLAKAIADKILAIIDQKKIGIQ